MAVGAGRVVEQPVQSLGGRGSCTSWRKGRKVGVMDSLATEWGLAGVRVGRMEGWREGRMSILQVEKQRPK